MYTEAQVTVRRFRLEAIKTRRALNARARGLGFKNYSHWCDGEDEGSV